VHGCLWQNLATASGRSIFDLRQRNRSCVPHWGGTEPDRTSCKGCAHQVTDSFQSGAGPATMIRAAPCWSVAEEWGFSIALERAEQPARRYVFFPGNSIGGLRACWNQSQGFQAYTWLTDLPKHPETAELSLEEGDFEPFLGQFAAAVNLIPAGSSTQIPALIWVARRAHGGDGPLAALMQHPGASSRHRATRGRPAQTQPRCLASTIKPAGKAVARGSQTAAEPTRTDNR
jgi:hypothetical protein